MGGRIWVEGVHAHDLIVRPRSQEFAAGRESDGMNCAGVIAHGSQLSRFGVIWIAGIVDGIRRPNADMAVCVALLSLQFFHGDVVLTSSSGDQSRTIRRDVTAVNIEVLLLSTMREPYGANVAHDSDC